VVEIYNANPTVDDPSDQLTLKIEDVTDPTVTPFETTFTTDHAGNPFDIAALLGSACGYVGFTGATGGENAEQDILDWTFDGVAVPLPGSSGTVIAVECRPGAITVIRACGATRKLSSSWLSSRV